MGKKNFLVLGSGAREHAICEKLLESEYLNKLFLADANDGFSGLGEKITYETFQELVEKSEEKKIDILVVGPENPLCDGITDVFLSRGIKVVGVTQRWSMLESSKYFAKKFMGKHAIKTADYKLVKNIKEAEFFEPPYVIKADGLCKGKGVAVVNNKDSALKIIKEYLVGKFAEASKTLLLEEFINGEELSLISIWDGKTLLDFPPARDFKRINSNPESPNTGGMGAFCPVRLNSIQQQKLADYSSRLENALRVENADFCGFLYSGLIWNEKKQDFYVLEYNVRLGDPETQAILNVLESDFGEILINAVEKKLGCIQPKWSTKPCACLTVAAKGYPSSPSDNKKITCIPENDELNKIYFAGVKRKDEGLYSSGGRILSICSKANKPFAKCLEIADSIDMQDKYYRKDLKL